jgi:hypothetical protein
MGCDGHKKLKTVAATVYIAIKMAQPPRFLLSSQPPKKTKWTPDEDDQLWAAVRLFGTDS